ncbi:1-deoxy-D-xylulose-5-phosphate synthase [Thermotoga sp. RQ2]|uniref:1-deoxy-D-xylulose-5-phosphate synthase n=1 Tax=Thermotoga sp. (strain RQ2) TaxID=126740 RepID=DXS_THESQ|nr:1-deoxy-D-xylulose-5-phosphate synthase [Thermotoga sp. RQ2]B1LAQ3.1 RecName: Full=1-deoxy-D-xylulose-5-phosphate synthase; AltName: Full=1-deoxyxylulose-5-phosphate synthase; Short=DXP synthase; Short=DXPS [Thermotoga sp. RQ2]ACB09401.1 deoxyxylulose-5-phosphate synthase [Thermotoga sp. RQ2]
MLLDEIKRMSYDELKRLAEDIRKKITEVVLKNGGHLASNLGTIELTLALYRVFDPREDAIIWDTGHQAYTHKILTGRDELFHTIRTFGGLSGFVTRRESPLDWFGTGHAGTSIAAGLGFEKAFELLGEKRHVVVVIGDGALTSGMALEALNQLKNINSKMKIILNDNGMSISPNVGGLAYHLSKLRTSPIYLKGKKVLKKVLEKTEIGFEVEEEMKYLRDSLKGMIQGTNFFESLGLKYFGPFDGHNIELLEKVFKRIRDYDYSSVVHVVTKKGKGFTAAEKDPTKYHSASPSGKPKMLSYSDLLGHTLSGIAREDKKIVAITAAMADGTGLSIFQREHPDRFFDLGITEQTCVTFGAALGLHGMKPVVAIYSTFLQRAYDQIIHDVALQNAPVLFAIDRSGVVGEDGPTHHGLFDMNYLLSVPNMKIISPSSPEEFVSSLYTVLKHLDGPVAIRYPKESFYGEVEFFLENMKEIDLGWKILKRGREAAIIATGTILNEVLKIPLDVTVVNALTVKPLDTTVLKEIAREHDLIITVEEAMKIGGFGSFVAQRLQEMGWQGKIVNLGVEDIFVPHGSRKELLSMLGLDSEGLTKTVLTYIKARSREGKV